MQPWIEELVHQVGLDTDGYILVVDSNNKSVDIEQYTEMVARKCMAEIWNVNFGTHIIGQSFYKDTVVEHLENALKIPQDTFTYDNEN